MLRSFFLVLKVATYETIFCIIQYVLGECLKSMITIMTNNLTDKIFS